MNSLSKFGKKLAAPTALLLALQWNAQAQNPVESTHIDEKYAYTTVVYKNKAADDKDVLSSLENDFSIGDVVRVTLAPPPSLTALTASEPVYADNSKGEDAWMPKAPQAPHDLTASTGLATKSNLDTKVIATAPKAVTIEKPVFPASKPVAAKAPVVAPKANTSDRFATSEKVAKAKGAGKASKAHKSPKKAGKKSSFKVKFKQRKKGRQRYACPTF